MRSRRTGLQSSLLAASLCLLVCGAAAAQPLAEQQPLQLTDASFMEIDEQVEGSLGHPNELHRWYGLKGYVQERYGYAIDQFERAAYHADKLSQHYLSLIYWHGAGVPVDRVKAYIWADLAAERGSHNLLLIREKMWSQLTEQQRAQALESGGEYYARYGDEVAKPRTEAAIRRFASEMTGSHLGYRHQRVDVTFGGPIYGSFYAVGQGMLSSSAAVTGGAKARVYYADARTRPSAYWQAQNRLLDGTVKVGEVEAVPTP